MCTELKEFGFPLSALTGDRDKCSSHPGDALWHLLPSSWSRVSASLCPEENNSHPEDLGKTLEVAGCIPCDHSG